MERGQEGDAQSAGKLLPFSRTWVGEERRGITGVGQVDRLPPIDRLGEPTAAGRALWMSRGSPVQDVLGGAACLATWGILWLLIVFAVISPLGSILSQQPRRSTAAASAPVRQTKRSAHFTTQNFAGRMQPVSDSGRLSDPAPSCQPGLIALNGRCILGEEIEVRPPPGWHRR